MAASTGPGVSNVSSEAGNVVPMARGPELGFKEHYMRVGDGRGGWSLRKAEFQFLHAVGDNVSPYTGPIQMDNGETILLAVMSLGEFEGERVERPAATFSKDRGQTWSDWYVVPEAKGRPTMLAYLGGGNLAFSAQPIRYFSNDYGRTWSEHITLPPGQEGGIWGTEGSPLIDRDASGNATNLAEVGWSNLDGWPEKPLTTYLRWSRDGGRTWENQTSPREWQWKDTFENKTYPRGTSEGSLVRADNGWIVAGLRMDMPAKWIAAHNDNYCGFGISVSKDNGKTWSPIKAVHHGGRMHGHFVKLGNGDLVMIYVMRQDIAQDGLSYASYKRGCGALLSRDNGRTWDISREYRLHEFDYATESRGISVLACGHCCSTLLDDGNILTAYGHYLSKGAAMIRWQP